MRSQRTRNSGVIVEIVAMVPVLTLKAGAAILRMKARRRKGVKVFRRQLRQSGLSKDQINELTEGYEKIGRLRSYLPDGLRALRFFRS